MVKSCNACNINTAEDEKEDNKKLLFFNFLKALNKQRNVNIRVVNIIRNACISAPVKIVKWRHSLSETNSKLYQAVQSLFLKTRALTQ